MAQHSQYCSFYLDKLLFGVELHSVQEVIRHLPTTQVPLAPAVVTGLINLRGQIVMAVDLRRRFGMPDRSEGDLPMNVVVRAEDGAVSFLVDEIGDVLEVEEESFERPPATLQGEARELVRGVYKLPQGLLLVLETERVASAGGFAAGRTGA
jgi:purine-binding chemotaxis protein CheW